MCIRDRGFLNHRVEVLYACIYVLDYVFYMCVYNFFITCMCVCLLYDTLDVLRVRM